MRSLPALHPLLYHVPKVPWTTARPSAPPTLAHTGHTETATVVTWPASPVSRKRFIPTPHGSPQRHRRCVMPSAVLLSALTRDELPRARNCRRRDGHAPLRAPPSSRGTTCAARQEALPVLAANFLAMDHVLAHVHQKQSSRRYARPLGGPCTACAATGPVAEVPMGPAPGAAHSTQQPAAFAQALGGRATALSA